METFSTNELRIKLFDKLTASGVSEKIKVDLFDLVATEIQAIRAITTWSAAPKVRHFIAPSDR